MYNNVPHNWDALSFDIKNAVCRSNIPLNTQRSEIGSRRMTQVGKSEPGQYNGQA